MDAYDRKNYEMALSEWLPLAEKGDAKAQLQLGIMYQSGHGVPRDFVEAARWYGLAGNQGNAEAQYNLGDLYHYGAVPKKSTEAARWYRMAAEQGHVHAQFWLGYLYEKGGGGVPQDYTYAHMWLNLAVSRDLESAFEERDKLAQKMTPQQIAESQRLAREWQAQHQK